MKKSMLYSLWGCLFILCAGLGFIPNPGLGGGIFLTALSVLFFVPPALLVYGAVKQKDTDTLRLVRNLSLLSLGLTLVTLILNFMGAMYSQSLGNFLHYVLVIVSSPMICSGYWVLSLFLWACLLMVTISRLRKK